MFNNLAIRSMESALRYCQSIAAEEGFTPLEEELLEFLPDFTKKLNEFWACLRVKEALIQQELLTEKRQEYWIFTLPSRAELDTQPAPAVVLDLEEEGEAELAPPEVLEWVCQQVETQEIPLAKIGLVRTETGLASVPAKRK